jgi:hypothetical protein
MYSLAWANGTRFWNDGGTNLEFTENRPRLRDMYDAR